MWTNTNVALYIKTGEAYGFSRDSDDPLAICSETMQEVKKMVGGSINNIDLAFVHFIWCETGG